MSPGSGPRTKRLKRPSRFVRATRRCEWNRKSRSFTLVEVLAALVLLAIILPVAMRGISLGTRTAGVARDRMVAASLAETTLNKITLSGEWRDGDLSGDYGEQWPEYSWNSEVHNWEESDLRQLDVHVEWTSRNEKRSVTLSTLVYGGGEENAR